MNTTIAFIGGGNMARSLIGGLIADGVAASQIIVAEPDNDRRSALQNHFGVLTTALGREAVQQAGTVVLAVKPQVLKAVCVDLKVSVQAQQPLLISIAAGIRSDDINQWLGGGCAIVRAMPNTPAMVQAGATGLFANEQVGDEQRAAADKILSAVGMTTWVDEEQKIDAVTALSGSGPAYFFYIIEILQAVGEKLGLDAETAATLALQTAHGSALYAQQSDASPAELRQQVTSPGGTTAAALEVLGAADLEVIFESALRAACQRAGELADDAAKTDDTQ